jgi:uncharacterized membrane protein AbrB (regulator of aidB expression)
MRMTRTQIQTLVGALAAVLGVVLELLGVPMATLVGGLLGGGLGLQRPSDASEVKTLRAEVQALRAGRPAPGSMDAEVERIVAGGVID